jgi:hypothetical protein
VEEKKVEIIVDNDENDENSKLKEVTVIHKPERKVPIRTPG